MDKPIKTGGPAFPCHTNPRPGELANAPQGMTLRDFFAAAALTGLTSASYQTWPPEKGGMGCHLTEPNEFQDFTHLAADAFDIADSMLAARNKTNHTEVTP